MKARGSKEASLKKTSLIWPIVLFPYHDRSHTSAYTGRRFIKDIKFSVSCATLFLTEKKLYCRLIFPHLLIFEIDTADITSASMDDKKEVLEIRFTNATFGWLTRFALSGDSAIPRDRLFLNLGDECEAWLERLNRHIMCRHSP